MQRDLALAVEARVGVAVLVEAHDEAPAARTHQETAIPLAAAEQLLRIRRVAVLAAGYVLQQFPADHAATACAPCTRKRRRQAMNPLTATPMSNTLSTAIPHTSCA